MANDGIERFEKVLGALSKIASGDDAPAHDLADARCPKCNASDFIKVSDLYDEVVRRIDSGTTSDAAGANQGGLGDRQILEELSPPFRRSFVPLTVAFAVPFAAASFFLYRRFGPIAGQVGGMVSVIAITIFLLTRARHLSDQYYDRKTRWNKSFMCRRCGQLISA